MNLNEISIWVGKVFDGLYIGWPYRVYDVEAIPYRLGKGHSGGAPCWCHQ